ncbi:nitroreductase family protein [Miniphocaeibacter massiliensis]|uniref:nitroreductase family protein n=1 Tax=Miniphocaeibacter massiliensis TaxID=2041841 RepID=UPI000C068C0F|nr:nitroreductase family protein [Miniphocaeibacter massiliensis]
MKLSEFMENRKSAREYRLKNLSNKDLKKVNEILKEVNEKANRYNINYQLFEGENIYKPLRGEGGYSGVMIEAPGYISLSMKEPNDESYIYGAYYLEDIIGKLSEIGYGTCWVSLFSVSDELKKDVFGTKDKIDFILAFGIPVNYILKGDSQYSNRLGLEDFIYINDLDTPVDVETLQNYGLDEIFYYLRNAPSAFNKQPWRFLIKDGKIDLFIKDYQGNVNLTDSGIVMYYYEKLAEIDGINASWDLNVDPCVETDMKFIGRTNF